MEAEASSTVAAWLKAAADAAPLPPPLPPPPSHGSQRSDGPSTFTASRQWAGLAVSRPSTSTDHSGVQGPPCDTSSNDNTVPAGYDRHRQPPVVEPELEIYLCSMPAARLERAASPPPTERRRPVGDGHRQQLVQPELEIYLCLDPNDDDNAGNLVRAGRIKDRRGLAQ